MISLSSWGASQLAARQARGRELSFATGSHALLLAGTACGALALSQTGASFAAFILALGCLALAAATLFAWFVERRVGPLAASVCFGLLAAYVPSLWAPILF
ncbi:MAG: hypothetical protein JKY65_25035 [Planctomycetes bacterium]|nr:hypothetical protein [Planctomycetota bacterium]